MATYNKSNAECFVLTSKEGLLSKAAHDLKIRVDQFEIQVEDASQAIEATFDSSSLRLVSAQVDGREESLSARDVEKIHNHIVKDVLHSKEFPEVRFVSSSVEPLEHGFRVKGSLTLHGQTRPLSADIRAEGEQWVTDVPLHQPDFGIKPFRALFGTIRIKPGVRIRVSVPRR
ncbi:MAG: YceI family protein [Myxococcales bacterium]|nr:YceI family protein [Myxococcales bacterium]